MKPSYPLTIFYDGACRMCVRQMEKFREKNTKNHLNFIDISQPDFDAKKYNLQNEPLQKYIYVKNQNGNVARGVDAFIWMWAATGNNILSFLAGLPVIKQLGKVLYKIISRLRYKLSGKKENVCNFHCAKEI